MNFDKTNRWLTLFANLGVLVGILFLVLEINQSNRIAVRDARNELTAQQHAVQMTFLENPDVASIMAKLSAGEELSREEKFRAQSYAMIILNEAASLNLTYENAFISDPVLRRYMKIHSAQIDRVPGIAPYLLNALQETGLDNRGVSPIFDNLLDAAER